MVKHVSFHMTCPHSPRGRNVSVETSFKKPVLGDCTFIPYGRDMMEVISRKKVKDKIVAC